jgi:hypothetical protein
VDYGILRVIGFWIALIFLPIGLGMLKEYLYDDCVESSYGWEKLKRAPILWWKGIVLLTAIGLLFLIVGLASLALYYISSFIYFIGN